MDPNKKSPFKKFLVWGGVGVLAILGVAVMVASGSNPSSSAIQTPSQAAAVVQTLPSVLPASGTSAPAQSASGLSNDNHYTNVSGNVAHSPAYSTDGAVPPGASAQCGDGTYSFSQHRSGTCSHHGGVSQWL